MNITDFFVSAVKNLSNAYLQGELIRFLRFLCRNSVDLCDDLVEIEALAVSFINDQKCTSLTQSVP